MDKNWKMCYSQMSVDFPPANLHEEDNYEVLFSFTSIMEYNSCRNQRKCLAFVCTGRGDDCNADVTIASGFHTACNLGGTAKRGQAILSSNSRFTPGGIFSSRGSFFVRIMHRKMKQQLFRDRGLSGGFLII